MGPIGRTLACALFMTAAAQTAPAQEAVEEAAAVFNMAWERCEFTLSAVFLVNQPAQGYGIFEPRADNIYRPGEPVHVYVEPACYGYEVAGDRYRFGMTADFQVMDQQGRILGGQEGFGEFRFESFRRNRELKIDLNYEFSNVPPGTYVIETMLHDQAGKGSATARVEVVYQAAATPGGG